MVKNIRQLYELLKLPYIDFIIIDIISETNGITNVEMDNLIGNIANLLKQYSDKYQRLPKLITINYKMKFSQMEEDDQFISISKGSNSLIISYPMDISENILSLINVIYHYSYLTTISTIYIQLSKSQYIDQQFIALPNLTNIYYTSFYETITMLSYGLLNHIIFPEDLWNVKDIETISKTILGINEWDMMPNYSKHYDIEIPFHSSIYSSMITILNHWGNIDAIGLYIDDLSGELMENIYVYEFADNNPYQVIFDLQKKFPTIQKIYIYTKLDYHALSDDYHKPLFEYRQLNSSSSLNIMKRKR